jgi:hypothetical protein
MSTPPGRASSTRSCQPRRDTSTTPSGAVDLRTSPSVFVVHRSVNAPSTLPTSTAATPTPPFAPSTASAFPSQPVLRMGRVRWPRAK